MHAFKSILFTLILLSGSVILHSQTLSEQAEISILSFGPGLEVYSIWGHTAIRVNDPVQRIDKVYNYGTYDFDTPNFLLKFIQGQLNYALSIQRYRRIVSAYKKENRWIREQILNLDPMEKNVLYQLLEENYLPENRLYKYDFFFDNCATRPLEIIEKSTDRTIFFNTSEKKTFRNILDEQLTHTPWLDFGIDLIIGARADKIATPRQQMFMPVYFYENFESASFKDTLTAAIKKEIPVFESNGPKWPGIPLIFKPVFLLIILLLLEFIILVNAIQKKQLIFKWYDNLWFILMGIGSLIILFMWFATDHLATKENWNILWINPLFLLLIMPWFKKIKRQISWTLSFFLAGSLLFWFLIPQAFHDAFALLMIIMFIKTIKYSALKSLLPTVKSDF